MKVMKSSNQSSTPSPASGATEEELFAGLAKVRTFPVDPSESGETPGQMLPPPAFVPKPPSVLQSPKLSDEAKRFANELDRKNGRAIEFNAHPPAIWMSCAIAKASKI